MKIALVAPYFHPVKGGREQTVLALAEGLAKKGHYVTVFTTNRTPEGKIVDVREENWDFSVNRIRSTYLAFRFEIPLKIPQLSGYDIVHIISTDNIFAFIFLMSAKIHRKRIFTTLFTVFALLRHPRKMLRPFFLFFELLSVVTMYLSDGVQVMNDVDMKIVKRFVKNVRMIPGGIPENYFIAKPTIDFRDRHGLSKRRVILFVNRIHPLKGPQLLIKALPDIMKEFPDVSIVLIGHDPVGFSNELKKIAEKLGVLDQVLFLGFVDEDEKIAAYDAADVVAIPSIGEFTEGFSIVLSEAWARGKTVVVTPSRALRDRVKSGSGYVAGYDAKSLAEAIVQGIKKPTTSPKVHSWYEVVDMIENEYSICCKSLN
ncbi:MAG: glycosyltransferase family 4 protein [Candidatus Methanoperedens sp.]|nr:glycosyltransferase family 4 protein [Candidatus Methanoperedens sp.]MCE8428762.1 glycosyltransferase family 4 protein [Candidatus Methanoperedens sp.]